MDLELIFWLVMAIPALGFFVLAALPAPDYTVSQSTLRRLRGERTH